MTDNSRVRSIWYQPPSEGVQECIGLEVGAPKRFLRLWPQTDPFRRESDDGWTWRMDHGHTMHETARIVWGADEGAGMAARVGELLDLHFRPYQIDHLRAYLATRPPHPFVPGGTDSTFGAAGTWCAAWVGDDQCGRPADEHPTPPNRNSGLAVEEDETHD